VVAPIRAGLVDDARLWWRFWSIRFAWLSRALGRRDCYLDRFAAGGAPIALSPNDREWLALRFSVPDSAMGIPSTRG
jgi:hypothetical protein